MQRGALFKFALFSFEPTPHIAPNHTLTHTSQPHMKERASDAANDEETILHEIVFALQGLCVPLHTRYIRFSLSSTRCVSECWTSPEREKDEDLDHILPAFHIPTAVEA